MGEVPAAIQLPDDRRNRWIRVCVCGLLTAWLAFCWGDRLPGAAAAQEEPDSLVEQPLDAGGNPPASDGAASSTPSTRKRTRTLLDTLKDGGLTGAIILLLSVVSVGFIVEHSLTIRKQVLMPDAVVASLDQLIGEGRVDEAIEACQRPENHSLFAHVVLAGLERYKGSEFGFAEYKAAVEEAGEDQTAKLYRKTEVLGVIGAIAPMLGLLGTVSGMIKCFNTIAGMGGMAKPDDLAAGIGEALVTTLEGLVVAIPTMVAFSYFRNRIDSLIAEAGKRVEQIMMPLGRRR
jgi:biopolymer transport protein ExbB